jgi:hypothetical protein
MKNFFVRTLKNFALPLALAVGCLVAPPAVKAGTIVGVNSMSGTGLGFVQVPVINTFSEGNDNQPGGPGTDSNIIVPIKRFDSTGYIDIEFQVRNSQPEGITEYLLSEFVDNNTGINWSGYILQLGFGTGAQFTQSTSSDALDFDAPGFDTPPTSAAFANVALADDILVFSNGLHSTGLQPYTFRIDVPDGITLFTLRQTPIPVPEPSTLVLAAGAALGLAAIKRRRGR